MKRTRERDSSSIFFISKWVIIVSIVIVSSLSFLLGYYVGKKDLPFSNNQMSIIPTEGSVVQNDTETADEGITPPDTDQKHEVYSPEESQPGEEQQNTYRTDQAAVDKNNQVSHQKQKPQPPRTGTANITYAVQTGAFKSPDEADSLRESLEKKGYTAYIIRTETKKHEILYKVMIGEFRTRREAEVLSLRIKKAEGLQAFVTFRTQEDVLR